MLNTASAIISFFGRLEDQIIELYENLAANEEYSEAKDTFLVLAKDNKRDRETVQRVYQEVVTDAIETGFSFTGLNEDDYQISTELAEGLSYSNVVRMAIDAEDKSSKFCIDASESSRSLLADIPQSFEWVAKRKNRRKEQLASLLE